LIDRAEIDALTYRVGEALESEPFVNLPRGARLRSGDRLSHRYVFVITPSRVMPLNLNLAKLAARHLVTLEEIIQNLSGGIEFELRSLLPPAIVQGGLKQDQDKRWDLWNALELGAFITLLFVARYSFIWQSKKEERHLMQRLKRARRAVIREAKRLGPLFKEIITASDKLFLTALAIVNRLRQARSAYRRTRSFCETAALARRTEITHVIDDSIKQLKLIVARLEETATRLAIFNAQPLPPSSVDDALNHLGIEISIALDADWAAHNADGLLTEPGLSRSSASYEKCQK
jgi:hypothetical protein